MFFKNKSLATLFLAFLFVFPVFATSIRKLTILHLNDTHGHFWKNKDGEGGAPALKTLIDRIRKEVASEGGYVLLLSAGDVNTGTPASDLLHAEPDFVAMNMLKFDAMTLGNHEFDPPRSVLATQQQMATFPFLSANIYDKNSKQRLFQTHLDKDFDGLKVTVFGLTTEDTPKRTNPRSVQDLHFRPVIEEAKDLVPSLRDKADLLIGLTHIGHYPGGHYAPNAPGDETLAQAVNGIDFILGGHTQTTVYPPDTQNGTKILQANEWGKYLGRIDISYDVDSKTIVESKYHLIPINQLKAEANQFSGEERYQGEYLPEDPEMLKVLEHYQSQLGEKFKQVVAHFEDDFIGRPAHLDKETNLGRLIAQSNAEILSGDIGIINKGGVRLNIPHGDVTYQDILTLFPFKNSLCSVDFGAKELKNYFEQIKDIIHLYGVTLYKNPNGQIIKIKVGEEELDLNSDQKKFRLVTNDFLAQGGDDHPVITHHPTFKQTEVDVLQAIIDFFHTHPVIKDKDFSQEHFLSLP